LEKAPDVIFEEIEKAYKDKKRIKRWIVVADRYLKSYGNDRFERHWKAEDIVQELITLILEGKRNWNPEKAPDLDQYIYLNILSIIDGKLRNRKIVLPPKAMVVSKDGEKEIDLIETHHKTDKDYITAELERSEKLEACYNKLLKDEDAALVFLEWKLTDKTKDIAESLGITDLEVEKHKKRIRYNLKKGLNNN